MKKFCITGVILFSTLITFSQSFKAVFELGGKKYRVTSASYPASSLVNGTQTFIATNGTKYTITIKNKVVVGHKVFTATGKKVTLTPATGGSPAENTCQSCITITWPDGKTEDICDNFNCNDFKVLTKSVTPQ